MAALAPLAACGEFGGPEHTETRSYDVTEHVATVRVSSGGGRIDIIAREHDVVRVTETLRYNTDKPTPQHALHGEQLVLTSGCGDLTGNCGVDYRLEVPSAVAARLDSAGGAVTVTALSGALDVDSDGGQVDGARIASTTFTARTGGGAADIQFTAPPDNIGIESGGGDVTIQLPKESYAVDASAAGGNTTINVPVDGASPHKISVRSGGGDVLVTPSTASR